MKWKRILAREFLIVIMVVVSGPLTGGVLWMRNEYIALRSESVDEKIAEIKSILRANWEPKPPLVLDPIDRQALSAEKRSLLGERYDLKGRLMSTKEIMKQIRLVFMWLTALAVARLLILGVLWSLRTLRST